MRAGRKDRRIEIQALTTSKSDFGSDNETWTLYKEVWACYIPVIGKESYSSNQVNSGITVNFRIDYIAGISARTHRIIYAGMIYDIFSVLEIEGRKQTLEIGAGAVGN